VHTSGVASSTPAAACSSSGSSVPCTSVDSVPVEEEPIAEPLRWRTYFTSIVCFEVMCECGEDAFMRSARAVQRR
jgi:hypothetical protein